MEYLWVMSSLFNIPYEQKAFTELTSQEKELVALSEESLEKAYAPYSCFSVGSAVRLADGKVFSGNNQENAAYPSGLCAERVALFKAKSESTSAIETIVVIARNNKGMIADAFACGGCRQVMMEYAILQEKPIKILMRDRTENYVEIADVRLLLPFSFEGKSMD